jgi:hypothetical protein
VTLLHGATGARPARSAGRGCLPFGLQEARRRGGSLAVVDGGRVPASHWRHASGTLRWVGCRRGALACWGGSARLRVPPHPRPFSRGEEGGDARAERGDDSVWAIPFGKLCSSFDISGSFSIESCFSLPLGEGLGVRGRLLGRCSKPRRMGCSLGVCAGEARCAGLPHANTSLGARR